MPNHVTSILTFHGEEKDVKELLDAIKGEPYKNWEDRMVDNPLDFNRLIPMPDELNITSGSQGSLGRNFLNGDKDAIERLAKMPKEEQDKCIELGQQYIENAKKYGAETWYNWAVNHWGTKWNAYDFKEDTDWHVIQFDTAWAHPFPIIEKMSQMFPDVLIEVQFADENLGNNVGSYDIKDGCTMNEYEPDGNEALRLACTIKGYVEGDDYRIDDDGEFHWCDGDDWDVDDETFNLGIDPSI